MAWAWLGHGMGTVQVLSRMVYTESRDLLFQSGEAHSDIHAVFPAPLEREIVENYCNYIECTPQPPDPRTGSSVRTCVMFE